MVSKTIIVRSPSRHGECVVVQSSRQLYPKSLKQCYSSSFLVPIAISGSGCNRWYGSADIELSRTARSGTGMYNVAFQSLATMVEVAYDMRSASTGATSMEEVAERINRKTYEQVGDPRTGERGIVLVRLFKTHPYGKLPADLQQAARNAMNGQEPSPDTQCLTLLASTGVTPEWNSRHNSRNHKAVPLPSTQIVERFPMVSQMIRQAGIEINTLMKPDVDCVLASPHQTYGAFHIIDALGSPYIPAQEDFVKPFGVKSVLGVCGLLPDGSFFVQLLFSRVQIPRAVAETCSTIAMAMKLALMPFMNRVFATDAKECGAPAAITEPETMQQLQNRLAVVEELLRVYEASVMDHAIKLDMAMRRLDQANEDVKQFAYIVSHDLRAPLVNLKGFSAELRQSLKSLETELDPVLPSLEAEKRGVIEAILRTDAPEALGFIESSATRMDGFINSVLMLSRLGRQELHPESIDLTQTVEVVLKNLTHQLEAHQAMACVDHLPRVFADPVAIERIVGNILSNAVNYLDPQRPGRIEVGGRKTEKETIFFVHDNGRGIAAEDMHKVFAPFRRAGKQDVPGEGMGMSYVQLLVRRHGGEITCESQFGVGTTFTVTLPNSAAETKGRTDGNTSIAA